MLVTFVGRGIHRIITIAEEFIRNLEKTAKINLPIIIMIIIISSY